MTATDRAILRSEPDVGIDELPAVRRELAYLDQAVSRVEHQAGLLIERVDAVMRPPSPETVAAERMMAPSPGVSDVATTIIGAREALNQIADRIGAVCDRVEL